MGKALNLMHCPCGWAGTAVELDHHLRIDHHIGEPPGRRPGFRAALDAHKRGLGHGLTFASCDAPACVDYWAAVGR
jgi:hypothetical protein